MSEYSVWLALLAAAVVTYLPRAAGVALSGRIHPGGALFRWVGCVAYALLAGLIARMIVLPVGPLQAVGLEVRLLGAGVALLAFYLTRQNLVLGVTAGVGLFVLLEW